MTWRMDATLGAVGAISQVRFVERCLGRIGAGGVGFGKIGGRRTRTD